MSSQLYLILNLLYLMSLVSHEKLLFGKVWRSQHDVMERRIATKCPLRGSDASSIITLMNVSITELLSVVFTSKA